MKTMDDDDDDNIKISSSSSESESESESEPSYHQDDGKPQIGKIVNQLCICRQAGCMARITDEPSDRHADIQSKSIDNFPRHQMQLMSLEEKLHLLILFLVGTFSFCGNMASLLAT